jgi:hypothetical protein
MERKDFQVVTGVLSHDVPVDRAHVEVLKASIKERGQIAPVVLRMEDRAVIDGFHRITACQELGLPEVAATLIDCDDQQFQDLRIISASMHKGVSFARVTLWVREMFLGSEWAQTFKPAEAFRVAGRTGEYVNMNQFERLWLAGVSSKQLYDVAAWCKAKAEVWCLSPEQIANMLEIADKASPYLLPLVRERKSNRAGVLTRSMLSKITQHIPDHRLQEAVVQKALAEKLTEQETQQLVVEIATAPSEEEMAERLNTDWWQKQRNKRAARTPIVTTPEEREEAALERQVALLVATLNSTTDRFHTLPQDLPDELRKVVDAALVEHWVAVQQWQGEEMDVVRYLREQVGLLIDANAKLEHDNAIVTGQLERLQRSIGLGQQMYKDQVS